MRLWLSYAELTENEDGTWGESRAEALMMAEDAIHGWLVVALRFGYWPDSLWAYDYRCTGNE